VEALKNQGIESTGFQNYIKSNAKGYSITQKIQNSILANICNVIIQPLFIKSQEYHLQD